MIFLHFVCVFVVVNILFSELYNVCYNSIILLKFKHNDYQECLFTVNYLHCLAAGYFSCFSLPLFILFNKVNGGVFCLADVNRFS